MLTWSRLTAPLPPLPRRHLLRISPQAFLRLSRCLLQSFKLRISWRISPIPPAPALLDEFLIEIHAIGQEHISQGALVLVMAVGLDRHVLPEGEVRGGLLGSLAEGLALLRAVDATEADTFRVLVVQDFEGVAVEDGDDRAGEVRREGELGSDMTLDLLEPVALLEAIASVH